MSGRRCPSVTDARLAESIYRAPRRKAFKAWSRSTSLTQEHRSREPGEVVEYQHTDPRHGESFKAGHRIFSTSHPWTFRPDRSHDQRSSTFRTNVCSSKTVTHWIYRDAERPSLLLLPIIPEPKQQASGPDLCT